MCGSAEVVGKMGQSPFSESPADVLSSARPACCRRLRGSPMATSCGVTGMPGRTCCRPLTTMTSSALRPSRTTRRPSTSGPSFTGAYSTLLSAPTLSTNFTLWSVPTALSLMSSALYSPLPISLTRANMPGVKRRSGFLNRPRAWIVPVFGSSSLSRNTMSPSCGWPCSLASPAHTGLCVSRELPRSPRSAMSTYLRYTCSSPSKDT